MRILKAAALYFALVFAAGFVLGTIRVLWIVPGFGARTAELIEAPFMFVAIVFAARWVVQRLALPPAPFPRLGVGFIALALMLGVEFTVVLMIRGLKIREYFASRDPVSGTVYFVMLGLFAVMPFLVGRSKTRGQFQKS
jgi:hypothetical protein